MHNSTDCQKSHDNLNEHGQCDDCREWVNAKPTPHRHYETARRAYTWTSFSPEKRANSECAYFDQIMHEFAESPQAQEKFERLFLLSLSAKSRCASSMITGPARFPVEKQRRASEREHKISGEMVAYIDRVRKAKTQEAYYAAHPEARPVMAGDADAVERLKEKLATLEKIQAQMVATNKIIRKKPVDRAALVVVLGNEERADAVLKPDCFGGIGFASFKLTNNNAKIKATRERISELEKRKATTPKDITVGGVRIVENTEAMRLQVFFDGKPAPAMIALLKSHAFKWAPSVMAWQRQLTNNAVYSFNHWILPELKKEA